MGPLSEIIMANRDKDIFISYSGKDREFVARLARDLATLRVKVWWDRGEMKVGDSLNRKIEEGIAASKWLAIVLSPNSVSSPWVKKELTAAYVKELERQDVYILPILYQECDIPLFLKDKVYADFRKSYRQGLDALLERLAPSLDLAVLEKLLSDQRTVILSAYAEVSINRREGYQQALVEKAHNGQPQERVSAITALFVIKHRFLESHLMTLTRDPSNSVRRWAVFYLGELRAKAALASVSELISDGSPDVRAAARDAYRKITGQSS